MEYILIISAELSSATPSEKWLRHACYQLDKSNDFQNYDDYTQKMNSLGYGLPPYQGENFIKLGDNASRVA